MQDVSNANGTKTENKKRKRDAERVDNTEEVSEKSKRVKTKEISPDKAPIGFPWDSVNYSCAYDSILSVILAVYTEQQDSWTVERVNMRLSEAAGYEKFR